MEHEIVAGPHAPDPPDLVAAHHANDPRPLGQGALALARRLGATTIVWTKARSVSGSRIALRLLVPTVASRYQGE